ncbi:phage protease [Psychrobacter pygoscelis]|uniref:phage protease n=1 Tax=Psychrobacter pygoscelis TaxID=2488563 RepID=UPI001039A264|nr:phage protease [Psychrobacter pygoscelis]
MSQPADNSQPKNSSYQQPYIAALSLEIATSSAVPEGSFLVFPEGETRARDGRPTECGSWKLDAVNGKSLAEALNALPTDMVIDYEHQTLYKEQNGKPAPAAGWLSAGQFEYVDGIGLCNKSPSWTAKATRAIADREYRYKSPVIAYDTDGNVTGVLNVAITNQPALLTLDELTALSQKLIAPLSKLSTSLNPSNNQDNPMKPLLKLIIAQLGLSADTTEEQAAEALNGELDKIKAAAADADVEVDADKPLAALSTVLTSINTTPDPAKYVPIATMNNTVAALNQQIVTLQGNQVDPAKQLITTALSDGRLLPAQQEWATSYAKQDPDGFAKYLEGVPRMVALTQSQTDGKPDPASHGNSKIAALSVEQKAVAAGMGISETDMLAQLNAEV